MNGTKVKIVNLNREQMAALRLMLKLEWMRLTDEAIKEAIANNLEHTGVTQEILSLGESYILMDTPMYEALREIQVTGKDKATLTLYQRSFDILHGLILNRYKSAHMNRVPDTIASDPSFKGTMGMMQQMCDLFDQHRDDLGKAFEAASDGFQPTELTTGAVGSQPKKNDGNLLN